MLIKLGLLFPPWLILLHGISLPTAVINYTGMLQQVNIVLSDRQFFQYVQISFSIIPSYSTNLSQYRHLKHSQLPLVVFFTVHVTELYKMID